MKPKHHFLIHYPRVLSSAGPLGNFSSMRFERKHREGKISSHVAISRVNVCHTIAVKHQLSLNVSFLNKRIPTDLPQEVHSAKTLSPIKTVEFRGSIARENSILMIPTDDDLSFRKISKILIYNTDTIYFITQELTDVYLDEHLQSYQIFSDDYIWKVLTLDNLKGFHVTHNVRLSNGDIYIVRKWK